MLLWWSSCPLKQIIMQYVVFHDTLTHFILIFHQEEKQRAYKREKKKDRKRKAQDAGMDSDLDPDMASLMGFSGFGGAKKN